MEEKFTSCKNLFLDIFRKHLSENFEEKEFKLTSNNFPKKCINELYFYKLSKEFSVNFKIDSSGDNINVSYEKIPIYIPPK
jgi:hypothetical protein